MNIEITAAQNKNAKQVQIFLAHTIRQYYVYQIQQ